MSSVSTRISAPTFSRRSKRAPKLPRFYEVNSAPRGAALSTGKPSFAAPGHDPRSRACVLPVGRQGPFSSFRERGPSHGGRARGRGGSAGGTGRRVRLEGLGRKGDKTWTDVICTPEFQHQPLGGSALAWRGRDGAQPGDPAARVALRAARAGLGSQVPLGAVRLRCAPPLMGAPHPGLSSGMVPDRQSGEHS